MAPILCVALPSGKIQARMILSLSVSFTCVTLLSEAPPMINAVTNSSWKSSVNNSQIIEGNDALLQKLPRQPNVCFENAIHLRTPRASLKKAVSNNSHCNDHEKTRARKFPGRYFCEKYKIPKCEDEKIPIV